MQTEDVQTVRRAAQTKLPVTVIAESEFRTGEGSERARRPVGRIFYTEPTKTPAAMRRVSCFRSTAVDYSSRFRRMDRGTSISNELRTPADAEDVDSVVDAFSLIGTACPAAVE